MKNILKTDWKNVGGQIERQIGSLKFAVFIIALFSISMIIGTFLESFYGTDFANRTVYKTWFFILIQFGMLLSIVFATFLRLPPKKRLYGFYTIHSGLIIIGIGSIITYVAGVDGHLTLSPNDPAREVVLSNDVLKISDEDGKQFTTILPYSAFQTKINKNYGPINILEYVPFATGKFAWSEPLKRYPPGAPVHSSKYYFKNAAAEETFTLSIHPESSSEFPSAQSLGPLAFYYMPFNFSACFAKNSPSGVIVWNAVTSECYTPEERGVEVKSTGTKNRFFVVKENGVLLTFFPELSPYPMNTDLQINQNSDVRSFSKKVFEDKAALFLFGKRVAFYSKSEKKWQVKDLQEKGASVALPWMGAEIALLEHQEELVPFNVPVATIPIQKNGALIKGDLRAVKLGIYGKEYWVSNYAPQSLYIEGKRVQIEVTKETLLLPFELALTQFKMDKDPGTNNPASYESFVKLFSNGVMSKHHVFMNNPLKHGGFTFYQASYSQDDAGNYSSTLSVNVDQGRVLKYLGSLMLVLGAVWHYYLNIKKKKKLEAEA